jgi:hypothetical protein
MKGKVNSMDEIWGNLANKTGDDMTTNEDDLPEIEIVVEEPVEETRTEAKTLKPDAVYIEMYVQRDNGNAPYLVAAAADGTVTDNVVPYVAHYVAQMAEEGRQIPFDVGSAILVQAPEICSHYQGPTGPYLTDKVAELMAKKELPMSAEEKDLINRVEKLMEDSGIPARKRRQDMKYMQAHA